MAGGVALDVAGGIALDVVVGIAAVASVGSSVGVDIIVRRNVRRLFKSGADLGD